MDDVALDTSRFFDEDLYFDNVKRQQPNKSVVVVVVVVVFRHL
jgi:hypothetical protein